MWFYIYFLHGHPWILQWIKSIFYKLDITIHGIVSQLSRYCDVINNPLWCHQQNEDWASETRGRCVKIVIFIVIYGFVMSCKKLNNICTLMMNCFCTHWSDIFMFIINTKITLSRVLKQFVTGVHTFFSIYSHIQLKQCNDITDYFADVLQMTTHYV